VSFCSATVLCLRETASQFPLSQTQNRQLPPERYVQVAPDWLTKYYKCNINIVRRNYGF